MSGTDTTSSEGIIELSSNEDNSSIEDLEEVSGANIVPNIDNYYSEEIDDTLYD